MMCTPSVILLRRKGRRERREMHGKGKEEGGGKEKYIEGAEGRGRRKDSGEGGERERKKREEGGGRFEGSCMNTSSSATYR